MVHDTEFRSAHIEGYRAEQGKRTGRVALKYESMDWLRKAWAIPGLHSFPGIYYAGAGILPADEDFYGMTWAYLRRARAGNVRHAEIFFNPQIHTGRGEAFETLSQHDTGAAAGRSRRGMSSGLIMRLLRHLPEVGALATREQALPFRERLLDAGGDASERGHPPEVFARAGSPTYSSTAANGARMRWRLPGRKARLPVFIQREVQKAERVDRGVRCVEEASI